MQNRIEGRPYRRYEPRELFTLLGERGGHCGNRLDKIVAMIGLWNERRRMRRVMAADMRNFNDAMFEDAGTTRKEAEREVRKPFWRA